MFVHWKNKGICEESKNLNLKCSSAHQPEKNTYPKICGPEGTKRHEIACRHLPIGSRVAIPFMDFEGKVEIPGPPCLGEANSSYCKMVSSVPISMPC